MAKKREKKEERKRAEVVVKASEERYRALFEQSRDAVYVTSRDGTIVDVNRSMLELFGYTREEFMGLRAQDTYVDPVQRRGYQREIEEKGAVRDYEVRLRKKDGTEMDCLVTATVRRAEDGSVIRYQGIIRDITERKWTEEALRESEQKYRTIVENVNAALIIHDLKGKILDVNRNACQLFGYEEDEIIGSHLSKFTTEELTQRIAPHLRELVEKRSLIFDSEALRSDGSTVPVSVSARVVSDEGDGIIQSFVQDITERKQAAEEIRRHHDQLTTLNAIAMSVISSLDLQEVLQTIQERVMKLLGEVYPPLFFLFNEEDQTFEVTPTRLQEQGLRRVEKLMGMNLEELSLPLAALVPALCEALLAGKPYVTDDLSALSELGISKRLIKDAQRALEINSIVGLPLWVKGKLVGVMLLVSPKEKIPEEEMELLSAITSQTAIAIENARLYEQTDEKLRHRVAELTALNAIAQSLTSSLALEDMLKSIVTRVAQVMRARICTVRLVEGNKLTIGAAVGYRDESSRQHTIEIDERLARIVRDQQPLVVEDLWKAEDIPPSRQMRAWQEEIHSFLGVPMISKGKTIGILSIYREEPHHFAQEEVRLLSTIANQAAIAIENARLHERVREHAEDLERLVQGRTRELQAIHAELLQSAKLAALGQLAAGVAHELNNPLGAISGYLELLREGIELGPREMDYMERIEKRIQQATKIVSELKTKWMPAEPAWQTIDINDILEETLSLVERRLSLDQIELQKEITPNLPQMHADVDRLEQVFINIITNARQAMGEGGTLRVTSRESRNGEWVEIIFADTGEGIAREHLDRIFDPFFTTRSPEEGMGLGLSVSHRHIRDHGGTIDVWSERGRGAVFRVALPPSGAKRCWEILDCEKKEGCIAIRENADYRCWSVMEDVSQCERCEVYRRKALPPLDGTLLPDSPVR